MNPVHAWEGCTYLLSPVGQRGKQVQRGTEMLGWCCSLVCAELPMV
jgi:hypothetical protein